MHGRGLQTVLGGCLTPSCLLQAVHESGVFQNGQRVPTFRDRFGDSNNFQQSGSEEPWVRAAAPCSSACLSTAEQCACPLLQAAALFTGRLDVPRQTPQGSQSILTAHIMSRSTALATVGRLGAASCNRAFVAIACLRMGMQSLLQPTGTPC